MSYCTLTEAIEGNGCPKCTAELAALLNIARLAERYHRDCGHKDDDHRCDLICEAWKKWRALHSDSDSTYERMKRGIGPSGERGIQKL